MTDLVLTNTFSGENRLRENVRTAAGERGFMVEKYGLVDTGNERIYTVTLGAASGAERPIAASALETAFNEHGAEVTEVRLVVKAKKDISDQMTLNFNRDPDQHPDNV